MIMLDFFLEFTTLAFNIKLKMFGVLDSFLSFLRTYEEKKTHNMLSLIVDQRFKSFHLVFSGPFTIGVPKKSV